MCLCSFMAAEYDDLPEPVKREVQAFADINVAWLKKTLLPSDRVMGVPWRTSAPAFCTSKPSLPPLARSRPAQPAALIASPSTTSFSVSKRNSAPLHASTAKPRSPSAAFSRPHWLLGRYNS